MSNTPRRTDLFLKPFLYIILIQKVGSLSELALLWICYDGELFEDGMLFSAVLCFTCDVLVIKSKYAKLKSNSQPK